MGKLIYESTDLSNRVSIYNGWLQWNMGLKSPKLCLTYRYLYVIDHCNAFSHPGTLKIAGEQKVLQKRKYQNEVGSCLK